MQASRDIPGALIGIAIVIVVFCVLQMNFTVDRILGAMACLFCGISMLIFPGAPPLPRTDTYMRTRHYIIAAPRPHKVLWLLFILGGMAVGWFIAVAMRLVR